MVRHVMSIYRLNSPAKQGTEIDILLYDKVKGVTLQIFQIILVLDNRN